VELHVCAETRFYIACVLHGEFTARALALTVDFYLVIVARAIARPIADAQRHVPGNVFRWYVHFMNWTHELIMP
jgi:hypothetical protein